MKSLLSLLVFLLCLSAQGAATNLIAGLISINGTSNSPPVAVGTLTFPPGYFYFQNGGMAQTNGLVINVQFTTDLTNYVTIATYGPSVTNPATDRFTPTYTAKTIYMRTQVITTNAVGVATTFVQ